MNRVDKPDSMRTLKSLGQHFLVDKGIVRRIAYAGGVKPGETVLEVGPGRAILTEALLEAGANVIALELDRGLHADLAERYADDARVTLHHTDALKFSMDQLPTPYKVVANLPYQVTTPLLFHLLESTPAPSEIVVMIQQEVADRILAQPGTKVYGVLTLGVQIRAEASRCFNVPPGAFRPPPKVKSTVIRITPREQPLLDADEIARFMAVVRASFGARRKTIKKAMGRLGLPNEQILAALEATDIDPQIRGERLDLETFRRLSQALYPNGLD